MKLRFGVIGMVGILAIASLPGEVLAQKLRVGSPFGFGGVLNTARIGNSPISQNFGVYQRGGYAPPPASASEPLEGVSFLIRPGKVGGDLVGSQDGPVARARAVPLAWTQSLSEGGVSRYFGSRTVYRGAQLERGVTNASLLLDPQALLASTAFSAPARVRGVSSGRPNDVLSGKDNADAPFYSSNSLTRTEGRSQTDMLESHLDMMHDRHLKQGWEWYSLGEYARSRSSFETAESLDRTDPESRAGSFFAAIADERYAEAVFGIRKIMTRDRRRNVFNQDFKLLDRSMPRDEDLLNREVFGQNRLTDQIQKFVTFAAPAGTQSISPLAMASVAYALWHSGNQEEAIHAAQTLREMEPGGVFAHLMDDMTAAREDSQESAAD